MGHGARRVAHGARSMAGGRRIRYPMAHVAEWQGVDYSSGEQKMRALILQYLLIFVCAAILPIYVFGLLAWAVVITVGLVEIIRFRRVGE